MFDCHAEAPCTSAIRAAKAVILEVPQAAESTIGCLAKCGEKNSERDMHRLTRKFGLTLPVKITETSVGSWQIPVLLLSSWLQFFLDYNLVHLMSGLRAPDPHRCAAQWKSFWESYQKIAPQHPIYERAARGEVDLSRCIGLLLHGDEGRTKKKAALLVISAQSILGFGCNQSPCGPEPYAKQLLNFSEHTMITRWLMGCLPKSYYDEEGGDNIFQQYLQVFVPDLQQIYEHGLRGVTGELFHFVVLHTKGDWPFLAKAFSLTRSFSNVSKGPTSAGTSKGICHCCLADRAEVPWEDWYSGNPVWRQTLGAESAFLGSPSLLSLAHDATNPEGFLGQDCFHAWHLGASKQFLASALVLLSETYPGRSVPARFDSMAREFFQWCRRNKQNPIIRKLGRETVGWPSTSDYPVAAWSKGSTSTVVLRWFLVACASRFALIEEGSLLQGTYAAAKEIHQFFSKSFREGVWVSRNKALELSAHGFAFLKKHGEVAKQAHRAGRSLFLFMPNLHRLHHLFYLLYDNAQVSNQCLNILSLSCQMDEDYIGRPSRVSRRVGVRQVILRTLQRSLASSYAKFVKRGFLIPER